MTVNLGELLQRFGPLAQIRAWKEVVGPLVAKQAQYLGIHQGPRGRAVYVYVPDPLWRGELQYKANDILKRFQDLLLKAGYAKQDLPKRIELVATTSPNVRPI